MWRINRLCFGGFGSYKRVFDNTMSIKMGIKNYLIADSFIFRHKKWITLKNEADPSFDSKVQREKKGYTKKSQIFALETNSTNDFKWQKLEDQYSAWLIRRSKISPTSIALLNGVNCKVSMTAHEELHNRLSNHTGKDWIGTLKIIAVEITKVP